MSTITNNTIPVVTDPKEETYKTKPKKKWQIILGKIWNVVKKILYGLVSAGLLYINPTPYFAGLVVGFIAGCVASEQMQQVVDKITIIRKKHPFLTPAFIVVSGILCPQVVAATASTVFGAHLGWMLSKHAKILLNKKNETSSVTEV